MVRTVKSHPEEEEDDDDEFISRTTDGASQKGGRGGDQKANAHRSKHSETEQRRRSKINERFQVLRDLIPQNDQKRDKASFLLEIIQYIQFLQEKLKTYEGTYPGWSQEPSKLIPWRNNCGPVESFIDQSQHVKNGSIHEDNIVFTSALLTNAQNSVQSDFSGVAPYKGTDHGAATQESPLNMPILPTLFEVVPAQPREGSFSDAEHLASQSRSQFWDGRPCTTTECAVPSYTPNEQEDLKIESGEASTSNAYSQGLLNTLTHALETSGVDLSQASISVQLDIGKRTNSGMTPTTSETKDHENPSCGNEAMAHYGAQGSDKDCNQAHKRIRTEQS